MSPAKVAPKSESDLAKEIVIRVTLPNGDPYEFNLHDVEWINLDDLLGEIQGQAQRYAFYAFLHVEAKDAHRASTTAARDYATEASEAVREELTTHNSAGTAIPPTEKRVTQALEGRDAYRKLQAAAERWERLVERIGVVRESLTQRRDMLTAVSMFRAPEASAKADDRAAYRLGRAKR